MNFKGNWSYKNNKQLYITGGLALGSVLAYSLIWAYKKLKGNKLSKWLEEYIEEVKEQAKEYKNAKTLPVDFIAYLMNLSTEIQIYLFSQEHSDLENERIKNLKNEKAYEDLVTETIELNEAYHQTAASIIKQRVGINMDNLKKMMQTIDQRELKLAINNKKKLYFDSDLPLIEKDKLKEAYIQYATTYTQHSRITAEQMAIMQKNPEYQETAFKIIFQNKFLLKDVIKSKYGVDSKYLDQLLEKHDLLKDSQIAYYHENLKSSVGII